MSVVPWREPVDPSVLVRDAVRMVVDHRVELARDADYSGDEVVTVVQVPQFRQAGQVPGARWVFEVMVGLSTTGPDVDSALAAAVSAHEGLLSHTGVRGVRFSSVRAESEPVQQSPHTPTGAITLVSTIRLFLRREHV